MTVVQVPDDVAALARETAARENQSLDQFVTSLLTAQLDALAKYNELKARAARGNKMAMRKILDRVPSVPPLPGDEL
jgi:hypothetical protein